MAEFAGQQLRCAPFDHNDTRSSTSGSVGRPETALAVKPQPPVVDQARPPLVLIGNSDLLLIGNAVVDLGERSEGIEVRVSSRAVVPVVGFSGEIGIRQ
jgi:hypothetical protein